MKAYKSKISETQGRCGKQNMLRPYLKFRLWAFVVRGYNNAYLNKNVDTSKWDKTHTYVFTITIALQKFNLLSDMQVWYHDW